MILKIQITNYLNSKHIQMTQILDIYFIQIPHLQDLAVVQCSFRYLFLPLLCYLILWFIESLRMAKINWILSFVADNDTWWILNRERYPSDIWPLFRDILLKQQGEVCKLLWPKIFNTFDNFLNLGQIIWTKYPRI